ncbi:MAG: phage tail tape measure protein [Nitrosomonadales bacterium]|nr:phage tail tape measure protein [Nitrosomonadales bacterium]
MSTKDLQLKVQLMIAEAGKILRPMQAILKQTQETSKALQIAKAHQKALSDQQKDIDGFRAAAKGIAIHRQELAKAQERIHSIKAAMEAAQYPTKAMQQAFKEATTEANHLKGNITRLTEKQERLRRELTASGADTHKLASFQRDLKTRMAEATHEVDKQRDALGDLSQRSNALRAARYGMDKSMAWKNRLQDSGMGAIGMGAAVGAPIYKTVKDYASFEDAMMGVARQVEGAKDANGRYTKTYFEMGDAIKAMSERIPLATTEIAAIVEAGARMGIQGKKDLLTYAETSAVMASAFDLPVDQVGENVAKIAALYKIPIKSIGELGDTINWLDDNALAKGGDIIDVMKRIAGTADTVGMKYKDAAALASTFLSLGAASEVAGTASNAIMTNLSIATMQGGKFHQGLDMLKMNDKAVQQGMSKDATGTILKVLDAIKALPQAKQLEATTRLFGKEFGDDAAKLAANLGEYRRQLELTNAVQANGSMQREADSRNQALSARYEMLRNTLFNVSSALGESLKPALVDIMQSIADVLSSVRAWVKEHPELTANLVKGAAIISTVVIGLGALAIGAAAALGPLADLGYGMTLMQIKGQAIISTVRGMKSVFSQLGSAATAMSERITIAWRASAPQKGVMWESIKSTWGGMWESVKAIPSKLERAFDITKQLATEVYGRLTANWNAARDAVESYAKSAIKTAGVKWNAVSSYVKNRGIGGMATDAAGGLLAFTKSIAAGAWARAAGGIRLIGQALIFAGRAALMNPIGLTITAITVAGAAIIKYWEPIKAFFGGFWQGLKEGLAPLQGIFDSIRAALEPLKPVWDWLVGALSRVWGWVAKLVEPFHSTSQELDAATEKGRGFGRWLGELIVTVAEMTGKFFSFGKDIVGGLIDGILAKWDDLKRTIGKLATLMPEWMRNPLDIHSPSRVFAELGGFTMQGLGQGLEAGQRGPLDAVRDMAKKLAAIGAGITLGGAAMAMPTLPSSTVALPEIPAAARDILDHHQTATLPGVAGISRTIADQHQAIALPGVKDIVRNIRDNHFLAPDGKTPLIDRSAPIQWDNRPPISQSRTEAASTVHMVNHFTITAAPGMNEQQLAQLVAREIDKLNRQQAASARSRLTDRE